MSRKSLFFGYFLQHLVDPRLPSWAGSLEVLENGGRETKGHKLFCRGLLFPALSGPPDDRRRKVGLGGRRNGTWRRLAHGAFACARCR
jgi:hypothetical protein